jgi:hypothetical protein
MNAIETMLQEVAAGTTGVNTYARGRKDYANLGDDSYPRLFVLAVNPIDIVSMNHSVTSSYEVVAEVATLCNFTSDVANNVAERELYLNTLAEMDAVCNRFVTRMSRDARNTAPIGRVARREIIHEHDDNLCGYVMTFTITIKETKAYQCT